MKLLMALSAALLLLFTDPLGVSPGVGINLPTQAPTKGAPIGMFAWITKAKTWTVEVQTGRGHGSGVIVDRCCDEEFVLTAYHVVQGVEDAPISLVWTEGDTDSVREAKVVKTSPSDDLALLVSHGINRGWAKLGETPDVGDLVIAMGFPMDIFPVVVSIGFVTGEQWEGEEHLTGHSASCWYGNSGGPLFDRFGRLVGINVLTTIYNGHANSDRMWAVHRDSIQRFVFGE